MPSASSAASCTPGTKNDSCQVPKPGPALHPGLSQPRGVKARSSPSAVFAVGRDAFPLPATPYPTLQRTCTLIALPSTRGSLDSRALCQHPSSPGSIASSPRHASLRVTPASPELLCTRVGTAGALGGRGTWHPCGARYAPDWCGTRATLCHTALPALMPSLC